MALAHEVDNNVIDCLLLVTHQLLKKVPQLLILGFKARELKLSTLLELLESL